MKTATSILKSTTKYLKSYVSMDNGNENLVLSWSSYLILYKNPKGGLILYKAYIFLGDIPNYYHAYYINFINWSFQNNQLSYMGLKIDPNNVHIHYHPGDTIYETNFFTENPSYYNHYFSSPSNKIYLSIKDQLVSEKVSVFDFTDACPMLSKISIKERTEKFVDPRFSNHRHQIYGENQDHAMLTGLVIHNL